MQRGPERLGERPPWGEGPLWAHSLRSLLLLSRAVSCLSPDSLGWKIFYVTGCLFVAVQNLEDWEVRPLQLGSLLRPAQGSWEPGLGPGACPALLLGRGIL